MPTGSRDSIFFGDTIGLVEFGTFAHGARVQLIGTRKSRDAIVFPAASKSIGATPREEPVPRAVDLLFFLVLPIEEE